MLAATQPSLFFEHLRIPFRLAEGRELWDALGPRHPLREAARFQSENGHGPRFASWPSRGQLEAPPRELRFGELPLYARLLDDLTCARWLEPLGAGWRRTEPIHDPEGRTVGSVWRDAAGSSFLPFQPDEAIHNFHSEAYRGLGRSALQGHLSSAALRGFYRVKHAIPRRAQIGLRRALSSHQRNASFPRWPVEPALIDFLRRLYLLVEASVGGPVPWIAPWPGSKSWALVLTHDVESRRGYESLHLLRDLEVEAGVRSSWNLVPARQGAGLRYSVSEGDVRRLAGEGFEIGVHGLRHDGRDVSSLENVRERAPQMREYARRWEAVGFRSPATHRRWEWMPLLGFDYDSSYADTDPFEPQGGGCCSWLPYFNGDLVELPITLPQDHTLFTILRQRDESVWVEKASAVRRQGGMALMLTHPDYMTAPELLGAYRRFLGEFAGDPSGWQALPREVSAWWRRRAASQVERVNGGWRVTGPAASEATVVLEAPRGVE
jgi:peptidoglycan/xylan/chitin deacetylase (PgdA/CDA1 family)